MKEVLSQLHGVSGLDNQPFGQNTAYRLVESRIKRKDRQTGLFTNGDYAYRAIITNDNDWDNKRLLHFIIKEEHQKKHLA